MQARTPTPKKSEKSDTLFAPQQSSPSPATPDLKKPNNTGGGGGVLFAPQSSHSPQSAFITPAQTSVKKPPGILFSPQSLTPITLSKRHEAMTAVLIEDPTMNRSRRDKPQSSHVKHRQKKCIRYLNPEIEARTSYTCRIKISTSSKNTPWNNE
eukprot:PhF_6_TR36338/c1_g3_i2/m.53252